MLSSATLTESHIEGFEDITRAIPGVSFGAGGAPGLDNIEIRGVSAGRPPRRRATEQTELHDAMLPTCLPRD